MKTGHRQGRCQAQRRRFLQRHRPLGVEALEGRLAPAILTVNSLADGPPNFGDWIVTLRDAIEAANRDGEPVFPGGPSGSGADEIRFQDGLRGEIVLNQDQVGVRSAMTISGPGAKVLTVNGNNLYTVFDVADFVAAASDVTISGLTITGGNAGASSGGGIINRENLTVRFCTIAGNSAQSGGGGIFHSRLIATDDEPTLRVENSTISNNPGGGIYSSEPFVLRNSTISGNSTGIFNFGEFPFFPQSLIQNGTITQNSIGILDNTGALRLNNTIVVGNGQDIYSSDPISPASFNNLVGPFGGGLSNGVNGNQVGVTDPKLGSLADNGGPTKTHALLVGSPAIDTGNNAKVPAGQTADQRGLARVFNGTIDIGAFEVQPFHPWHNYGKPLDVSDDAHVAANDVVAAINYINAGFSAAVPADAAIGQPHGFLDVNADDFVAANDALDVINAINAGMGGEGEWAGGRSQNSERGNQSEVDAALMMLLGLDGNAQAGRRKGG